MSSSTSCKSKILNTKSDDSLGNRSNHVKDSDDDSYPSNCSLDSGKGRRNQSYAGKPLEPPVLVYYESARSIVFRDHLRRADVNDASREPSSSSTVTAAGGAAMGKTKGTTGKPGSVGSSSPRSTTAGRKNSGEWQEDTGNPPSQALIVGHTTPKVVPLASLDFGPNDEFQDLLNSKCPTFADDGENDGSVKDSEIFLTDAELEVVEMLHEQRCCVKTIKNPDWTAFLDRFHHPLPKSSRQTLHDDIPPSSSTPSDVERNQWRRFNSFVTSTTMLPSDGKKMRAFGSTNQYTVGVVFALPRSADYCLYDYLEGADGSDVNTFTSAYNLAEEDTAAATETWSWPAGYSAKTEFNISSNGKLINGRQDALRSLTTLRSYNNDYCTKQQYMVGMRLVSGLSQIPYNEIYLRVGGCGRLVRGKDVSQNTATSGTVKRSFATGVGLPIALFVRTAKFGDLVALLRTRARMTYALGENNIKGIPLLYIDPERGVRVLTDHLQAQLWKIASNQLNPFQNTSIAHMTTVSHTNDSAFQQKVEELIQLDDTIQNMLTPEELVRIAGGFGATDESVASILQNVVKLDQKLNKERINQRNNTDHNYGSGNGDTDAVNDDNETSKPPVEFVHDSSHRLQDVVNEGLAAAVRAGDYHTSRQLLILYSLVATVSAQDNDDVDDDLDNLDHFQGGPKTIDDDTGIVNSHTNHPHDTPDNDSCRKVNNKNKNGSTTATNNENGLPREKNSQGHNIIKSNQNNKLSTHRNPARLPPPPPLDTDRLRGATNSDGLLAVLGAAEVLKSMQTGAARRRTLEAVSAVDEWVDHGKQSMAFRISSWYDQRNAQGDLKIATESNTDFLAFVSNKAISNRRAFAENLRAAALETDFTDVRFLLAVDALLSKMHSPCLRLELLQYILGLDNRYSVAHVKRSVELATSCLQVAAAAASHQSPDQPNFNSSPSSPQLQLTFGR